MAKVIFLRDYRGVRTGEAFYRAGETVEVSDQDAKALEEMGAAEIVAEPKRKTAPGRPRKTAAK